MTNIRLFILFRILFHSRFYYPIFAILFLDLGLSLAQFSLLNLVWALTIIISEVPSGALADVIGRKKLVILSAAIMVFEMLCLLLAPRNSPYTFLILMGNRILSGLAEAASSGADEALAYDSLKNVSEKEKDAAWAKVLKSLIQYKSIAMAIAMLTGAFFYDYAWLSQNFKFWATNISKEFTLRIPSFLCLLSGILAFFTALLMKDQKEEKLQSLKECKSTIKDSFQKVFKVGRFIYNQKILVFLLAFALAFDSTTRIFITLASKFMDELDFSRSSFGLITAALSLSGILFAGLTERIVSQSSLKKLTSLVFLIILLNHIGTLFITSKWAILFLFVNSFSMGLVTFSLSFYLNKYSTNENRATVLSYKGLLLNLSYGIGSVAYAQYAGTSNELNNTLLFFPVYLCVFCFIAFIFINSNKKSEQEAT